MSTLLTIGLCVGCLILGIGIGGSIFGKMYNESLNRIKADYARLLAEVDRLRRKVEQ